MQIRQMTPQQAYEIYRDAFIEAFPPAERRPWRNILAMMKQDTYECYGGYSENGALLCCAFFVRVEEVYLMDYLLTVPASRGEGLGSLFLQGLLNGVFSRRVVLGEVEAPDGGEQDALRRRRLAFYERNRFVQTDVMGWVYGVKYRIIAWNLPRGTTAEALEDRLMEMYCALMGPDRCAQWVRLWRQRPEE